MMAKGKDRHKLLQELIEFGQEYQAKLNEMVVNLDLETDSVLKQHQTDLCSDNCNEEARIFLSPATRSSIYDSVVAKHKSESKVVHPKSDHSSLYKDLFADARNRPKQELEMQSQDEYASLSLERNRKRRRRCFRGKKVHTAKKSYKEVVREVIENHCQLIKHEWSAGQTAAAGDSRLGKSPVGKRKNPAQHSQVDKRLRSDSERHRHRHAH